MFSLRYGFNYISDILVKEVKECPYSWDFQGKHVYLSENVEYEVGYQNNFFIMRPKGEWIFRTKEDYLSEDDGFFKPYIEPVPYQRFKIVQGFKLYKDDEDIWVNEEKFYERYRNRKQIT
jgi:hypothetical protein